MTESLTHYPKSEMARYNERQREIDQRVVTRLGKYAVEAPSQDQLSALHQEAIADDYKRGMAKKGYEFVTNEPSGGHKSIDGRRVNVLKNMEGKYGWVNTEAGQAYDRQGNELPGFRSVYVHRKTKRQVDRGHRIAA